MLVLRDIGHLLVSGAWGALIGFIVTAIVATIFVVTVLRLQKRHPSEVQESRSELVLVGLKYCIVGAASGEVAGLVSLWLITPVVIIAFLVLLALTRRELRRYE